VIFYDASEVRSNSRVSRSLLDSDAQSVVGLEAATGTDFLVSALDGPPLPDNLKPGVRPHEIALRRHLGMLVQRKSGRDLPNSVPRLTSEVLPRMQAASPAWGCWLLATGCYGRNRAGNVTVGCNRLETEWLWNALNGALAAWQLDGGYYDVVGDDELVVPWLERAEVRLVEWQREGRPDRVTLRQPTRDVQLSDKDHCALVVLAALPGIGEKRARACLETWGDLSTALMWLSDPDLHEDGLYPPGIGPKTLESVRDCLGGQLQRIV
jgi:hypothetical protein